MPDNNNLFEEFKFKGLWIPHCNLWIDISNLLIHLANSLMWKNSPEWEEQASAICLEFKWNLFIAPEEAKGMAWKIFIADLGKIKSLLC